MTGSGAPRALSGVSTAAAERKKSRERTPSAVTAH
jgi:hypothetical protein